MIILRHLNHPAPLPLSGICLPGNLPVIRIEWKYTFCYKLYTHLQILKKTVTYFFQDFQNINFADTKNRI